MNTVDILKAARAKIANPENWGQGAYAFDSEGCSINPKADGACRFCASGAIKASAADYYAQRAAFELLSNRGLGLEKGHSFDCEANIVSYNDSPVINHADILAAFDKAIGE
jgi:hypothetical protein